MARHGLKLKDFEGAWRLDRQIDDRRSGNGGTLTGEAQFVPMPDGRLNYVETGQLDFGTGNAMDAQQSFIWQGGDKGEIAVTFSDGRPFHVIEPDRMMPDASHLCHPDFYHVTYDFSVWPAWSVIWRVVGPAKDYRLISRYRRFG